MVWGSNPGGGLSAPIQTAPGTHPTSYTMGIRVLSLGVKWLRHGINHTPHLAPRSIKKE